MKNETNIKYKKGRKSINMGDPNPTQKNPKMLSVIKETEKTSLRDIKRQLISKMTKIIFLTKQIWPLSRGESSKELKKKRV